MGEEGRTDVVTTTMNPLVRWIAALVAGAIGFFAGLFVLLATTGLERPSWAPVAMLTGAVLFGTAAAAILAGLPAPTIGGVTIAATVIGAIIGALLRILDDSYEWVIVAGIVLVTVAVAGTGALADDPG